MGDQHGVFTYFRRTVGIGMGWDYGRTHLDLEPGLYESRVLGHTLDFGLRFVNGFGGLGFSV